MVFRHWCCDKVSQAAPENALKTGFYTREAIADRQRAREFVRSSRQLIADVQGDVPRVRVSFVAQLIGLLRPRMLEAIPV